MRIDHIQLAMPPGQEAEELARSFFCGVLGMREDEKPWPLSERGGCWFRLEEAIVHVGVEEGFHPQKKAHPAFLIGDIEGLARSLETGGHAVDWDEALPDRRRFYTSDPFGNRLEFMRDKDGFSQK